MTLVLVVVIPFLMAIINILGFPNPTSIFAACVCAGLGFFGLWFYVKTEIL